MSCYYKDAAGYPTIGYGHLIKAGDPYGPGTCISQDQGEQLLARDAQGFVNCVNGMGVSLNQHQFDALVSFAYNLGCGSLGGVKSLIASGNYGGVCGEIEQYVHAGGQVLQGLVRRRQAECNLFNS
jgi:lysozyme